MNDPNLVLIVKFYKRVHCKKGNFTAEAQRARSFAEKFRREIRFYQSSSAFISGSNDFFHWTHKTDSEREPVREWLKSLAPEQRQIIGEDIKAVQFGWPLGMPLVRKLAADLWEVRSSLPQRIARVLFTVVGHQMVLLHGFIKKSQRLPQNELGTAQRRLYSVQQEDRDNE